MNYTITVKFLQPGRVRIDPNYLPNASPGDSVAWLIEPAAKEVQVLFDNARVLSDDGELGPPLVCNPMGPFRNLSLGAGLITGTVHSNPYGGDHTKRRRFFYRLFEKGSELTIENPISGSGNRGGIEIPMTPAAESAD